jgi:dihydrofolate reductase
MGHKTFRDMAAYWPTSTEVFAAPMNDIPKVVFARGGIAVKDSATTRALEDARAQASAQKPAAADVMRSWTHPRVATGDIVEEVAKLKQEPGKDILAHGGSGFAQSLVQHDLVDEFRLLVYPIVLGRGLPLFAKAEAPLALELVEILPFPTGSAAHIYRRAGR